MQDSGAGADATEPTTESLATVPRMPLSVRLIGRSSLPGAAVVLGIALVFIIVVPWAAALVTREAAGTPQVLAVGDSVRITVPEGWAVSEQGATSATLVNGSATLVVTDAPAAALEDAVAVLAADAAATWVISEPADFTTDAGDSGRTVTAASETESTQVWVVDNAGTHVMAALTAPVESWARVEPSGQQIVESIVVDGGATESATP